MVLNDGPHKRATVMVGDSITKAYFVWGSRATSVGGAIKHLLDTTIGMLDTVNCFSKSSVVGINISAGGGCKQALKSIEVPR